MQAVTKLNDQRNGSSIMAIRKYILQNFNMHNQTASFQNLTLKAVNKAVAMNELERVKNSFRLSNRERERQKEAERSAVLRARQQLKNVRYISSTKFDLCECRSMQMPRGIGPLFMLSTSGMSPIGRITTISYYSLNIF